MKHFTIENETNNIMVHGSAKEAEAMANTQRLATKAQLSKLAAEWPAARLIEIWNSVPGVVAVTRFKDRNTAVSRIWKAIQSLGAAKSSDVEQEVAPAADAAPAAEANLAAEATVPASDTTAAVAPHSADVAPEQDAGNEDGTRATETPSAPVVDVEVCTELLRIAALAQTAYWEALRSLENAIGFELGDPGDLKETTIEALVVQHEARLKSRQRRQGIRESSKTAQVIAMLKRDTGATLDEIMAAMQWQKHTTRAMLSAGGSLVKNHELVITSEKDCESRRYFIKA